MIRALKKLLGNSEPAHPADDSLSRASQQSSDFVAELARSDVWILGLGDSSALPFESFTEGKLLEHVERNAKELSEHPTGDRTRPYQFTRGADTVQPFFSSLAFAEHFIRNTRWEQLLAFHTIPVAAGYLVSPDLSDRLLVLNPISRSERVLSAVERQCLCDHVRST